MGREINFRVGKGRATEQKKAYSPKSIIAAMRFVGMTDQEIKAVLDKAKEERTKDKP